MEVGGREFRPNDPLDAMAAGIAYVPADRVEEGAATELTLRENIFMNPDKPSLRRIRGRAEKGQARTLLGRFDVRPPEPEAELSTLSGGNAQKVVIAKWLRTRPRLLGARRTDGRGRRGRPRRDLHQDPGRAPRGHERSSDQFGLRGDRAGCRPCRRPAPWVASSSRSPGATSPRTPLAARCTGQREGEGAVRADRPRLRR